VFAIAVAGMVGATHLVESVEAALDDEEFMEGSARAMFATIVFCALRRPGWVGRLMTLAQRHGKNPVVAASVRAWAMRAYCVDRGLDSSDEAALRRFLLDEYTAGVGAGERARARGEVAGKLDAARREGRRRLNLLQEGTADDGAEVEEEAGEG